METKPMSAPMIIFCVVAFPMIILPMALREVLQRKAIRQREESLALTRRAVEFQKRSVQLQEEANAMLCEILKKYPPLISTLE
jgi:hypothetical protein